MNDNFSELLNSLKGVTDTQAIGIGKAFVIDKEKGIMGENFEASIKSLEPNNPDSRKFEISASTEDEDRHEDIVEIAGWETDNYNRIGNILWAHNYSMPPIAKPIGKAVKNRELKALTIPIEFARKETYEFADTIRKLVSEGFIKTVSVGFIPKKWIDRADEEKDKNKEDTPTRQQGRRYKKQELLEVSIVPVPANPYATIQNAITAAASSGIISNNEYSFFEKVCSLGGTNPNFHTYSITNLPKSTDEDKILIPYSEYKRLNDLVLDLQDFGARLERGIIKKVDTLSETIINDNVLLRNRLNEVLLEVRDMVIEVSNSQKPNDSVKGLQSKSLVEKLKKARESLS